MDDAFTREKQVQGWSRAKKRALIEGRMDDLPALARNKAARNRSLSSSKRRPFDKLRERK